MSAVPIQKIVLGVKVSIMQGTLSAGNPYLLHEIQHNQAIQYYK